MLGVVALAHVTGFLWFSMQVAQKKFRHAFGEAPPDSAFDVLFFDPDDVADSASSPPEKPVTKDTGRKNAAVTKRALKDANAIQAGATEAIGKPEVATPPASIDWAREAEQVAASGRALSRPNEQPLGPKTDVARGLNSASGKKEFGWSHSAIEPIEVHPGGTLIWLNERCAIVVSGMIFPVCSIGEIPVRGDLFEHMDDPPELGAEPLP